MFGYRNFSLPPKEVVLAFVTLILVLWTVVYFFLLHPVAWFGSPHSSTYGFHPEDLLRYLCCSATTQVNPVTTDLGIPLIELFLFVRNWCSICLFLSNFFPPFGTCFFRRRTFAPNSVVRSLSSCALNMLPGPPGLGLSLDLPTSPNVRFPGVTVVAKCI